MVKKKKVMKASEFKVNCFEHFNDKELDLMEREGLNVNQLFFMKILFIGKVAKLYQLIGIDLVNTKSKEDVKNISKSDLQDLWSLGFTDKIWKKTKNDPFPDDINLTKEGELLMSELIGIDLDIANSQLESNKQARLEKTRVKERFTKELFQVYPGTIKSDGKTLVLTACNPVLYNNKEYSGKSSIGELYCIIIDYDEQLHQEIISKIQNDVSGNGGLTNQKITSFILNKTWEEMENNNFIKKDLNL